MFFLFYIYIINTMLFCSEPCYKLFNTIIYCFCKGLAEKYKTSTITFLTLFFLNSIQFFLIQDKCSAVSVSLFGCVYCIPCCIPEVFFANICSHAHMKIRKDYRYICLIVLLLIDDIQGYSLKSTET